MKFIAQFRWKLKETLKTGEKQRNPRKIEIQGEKQGKGENQMEKRSTHLYYPAAAGQSTMSAHCIAT